MGFLHVSGNEPQIALLADISELCLASRGELQHRPSYSPVAGPKAESSKGKVQVVTQKCLFSVT